MQKTVKFGFYISGKSRRLYKFLMQTDNRTLESIKLIISDEEIQPELKKILEEKGIAYRETEFYKLPGDTKEKGRIFSDYMLELFTEYEIGYCFSFGLHILSGELLQKYEYRLINFHPSVLPMFSGKNAIDRAVKDGNIFLAGNTAHFIDESIDAGKIIMQSIVPLQAFLDADHDYDVILDMQLDMIKQLMFVINNDRLRIIDGRVKILGADYQQKVIYPLVTDRRQEKENAIYLYDEPGNKTV